MEVVEAADPATEAADRIGQRLEALLSEQDRASIAVSGGSTPWPMLKALAALPFAWERIDIYQVDERVAPAGDPARNLAGLAPIFAGTSAALHPMPVEDPDLDAAAERYEAVLPDRLDIVQLGLGDDGHTASLVPGDPVLDIADRKVAITGPYRGHRRMTLTFQAIDRAGWRVWLVSGESKREALAKLLAGDPGIPAGRVTQRETLVVADRAALGTVF